MSSRGAEVWSAERPTEHGVYWVRLIDNDEPLLVNFTGAIQFLGSDWDASYDKVWRWGPRIPEPEWLAALEALARAAMWNVGGVTDALHALHRLMDIENARRKR